MRKLSFLLCLLLIIFNYLHANYFFKSVDTIQLFSENLPASIDNFYLDNSTKKFYVSDNILNKIFVFDRQKKLLDSFFSKPYINKNTALKKEDINLIKNTTLKIISDKLVRDIYFFKIIDNKIFTGVIEQNNKYYLYIHSKEGNFIRHIVFDIDKIIDINYVSDREYYLITKTRDEYFFKQYVDNKNTIRFKPEQTPEVYPTKIHIDGNNIYIGYNNKDLKRYDFNGRQRMIFFRDFYDYFSIPDIKTEKQILKDKYCFMPHKINYFNGNIYVKDYIDNKWKKLNETFTKKDNWTEIVNNRNITDIFNNAVVIDNNINIIQNNQFRKLNNIIENNLFNFLGINNNNEKYYFVHNDISGYYNKDIGFNTIEIFKNNKKTRTLKNLLWNDNQRLKDLLNIHITDEGFIIFVFYNQIELYYKTGSYITTKKFENNIIDITSNKDVIYLLKHNNTISKYQITKNKKSNNLYMTNKTVISPLDGFAYSPAYSYNNNNIFYSGRFEDSNKDGTIGFEDKLSIYKLNLNFTEFKNLTEDFRWYGSPVSNPDNTKIAFIQLNFQQSEFRNTSINIMDYTGTNQVTLLNLRGIAADIVWLDTKRIIFLNRLNERTNIILLDTTTGNWRTVKSFDHKIIRLSLNISKNKIVLIFDEKVNFTDDDIDTSPKKIKSLEDDNEHINIQELNILSTGKISGISPQEKQTISKHQIIKSNIHLFDLKQYDDELTIEYSEQLNIDGMLIQSVKYLTNNEILFIPLPANNFSEIYYYNLLTKDQYLIKSFPFYVDEFAISHNRNNIALTADILDKRILLQYNLLNINQESEPRYSAGRGIVRTNEFDNSNFKIFSLLSNEIVLSNFTGSFYIDNLKEGFDYLFVIRDNFETKEIMNILISPFTIKNFGSIESTNLDYPIYNEALNNYMDNNLSEFLGKKSLIETFLTEKILVDKYLTYKNELLILNDKMSDNNLNNDILAKINYVYLKKLHNNLMKDFILESNFYNFNTDFINHYLTLTYSILNIENIIKNNQTELLSLFNSNDNLYRIFFNFLTNNIRYLTKNDNVDYLLKQDSKEVSRLNYFMPYHLHKMEHRFISREELNQLNIERQLRF